jgi:glycerol-3-phosphate O-acyltransferase
MMTSATRRAVAHEVLNSERFAAELSVVARKAGKPLTEARNEAYIALRALVSVQTPFFGFLFDRGLGPLHTRAWFLDVDWAALSVNGALSPLRL